MQRLLFCLLASFLTLPIPASGSTLPESESNFRFAIDQVQSTLGAEVELSIRNISEPPKPGVGKGTAISSFSFFIDYDTTQLALLRVERGQVLVEQGWEALFVGVPVDCSGGVCKTLGQVSIRATAESKYKEGHPELTRQNTGEWIHLKFKVKDDCRLSGQVLPVSWYWENCSDNTLTNFTGNRIWVVDSLINWDGQSIDFRTIFAKAFVKCDTFPTKNGKTQTARGITFVNGGIALPAYERFRLVIDTVSAVFQGADVEVGIRNVVDATGSNLVSGKSVGGFSLLLSYDCACLQLLSARKGQLLIHQGWEFFTWRFGPVGNGSCGSGCPSCLIRITAIADVNNGDLHPNLTRENRGEWAVLKFRISSDRHLAGQLCQINWFWFDCTDNTIADSAGERIWTVDSLYAASGNYIDLATAFPNDVSACTTSVMAGKPQPKKFIAFVNGGVRLPTPELPDPRGTNSQKSPRQMPESFSLSQNYPNPFNPSTSFTLSIPKASRYSVRIYNLAGQVVKTFEGEAPAGTHTLSWNGTDQNGVPVSSGIYLYKAETNGFSQTKKMILIR